MKKITFTLLICISILSCKKIDSPENQISWQSFYFKSDIIAGKYVEKYAMFVPVTIENDTTKFEMQFDTGANMTEFYENPIRQINSIASKIDTFNANQYSAALELKIDHLNSQVKAFPIRKNWGGKKSKLIGTIGTNEFKNKILIINYPKQKFAVLDSINSNYIKKFELIDFEDTEGQTYLRLKIANKIYNFLFDTGTSTTPLITNMQLYEKFTGNHKEDIDTIRAKSWGVDVIAPGAKNNYPISVGNIKLKANQRVYGTDSEHTLDFFKANNLDGLISNPYFFKDIILIDFRNKKFGVKK